MTLSDYIMCILLFFVLALFVAVLLWVAVMILLHRKTTRSKHGVHPDGLKYYEWGIEQGKDNSVENLSNGENCE
jgi:NADH:ubiquinone oxidoreductase subunit 3 (subunit A)